MEQSMFLHLVIAILSLYLFIVFSWWWIKQGRVSTIYGLTCFLMLGLFASHIGAWWIYHRVEGGANPMNILSVYIYSRHYLTLIPLVLYAIYVTDRACFYKPTKYNRRKTDPK